MKKTAFDLNLVVVDARKVTLKRHGSAIISLSGYFDEEYRALRSSDYLDARPRQRPQERAQGSAKKYIKRNHI